MSYRATWSQTEPCFVDQMVQKYYMGKYLSHVVSCSAIDTMAQIWVRLIAVSLLGLVTARPADWQPWTSDYTPDYVLSATAKNVTINCLSRYSVVFNDTLPGPPLHLKENYTTWVRVYNNIADQNLTVVSSDGRFAV